MRIIDGLKKYLRRRALPVRFEDLTRMKPVHEEFGLEYGTPIDRWYIERFLKEEHAAIRGDVLEVGESFYTDRFGFGVRSKSILCTRSEKRKGIIVGDLTRPDTLPAQRFDCFICTQTFNFIFDVKAAVNGAATILKPGGVLLGTVAGYCSQVSRYDYENWGDYWRFSDQAIKALLLPHFSRIKVLGMGNVAAAKALQDGIVVEQLPTLESLAYMDPIYPVIIAFRAIK